MGNAMGEIARYEPTLKIIINAWLHAKLQRTKSQATHDRYESTLGAFRALLHETGVDLDGDPALIATLAQGWAAQSTRRESVGGATFNQRLATLSSFYRFAIRKGYPGYSVNPIDRVDRARVEPYANVQALAHTTLKTRLAAIDTSMLLGMRDKALLMVALTTGRRLSEIAGMRRQHIRYDPLRITITFPRVKGGKVKHDELTSSVSTLLSDYLAAVDTAGITHDSDAVWITLSRNPRYQGKPLSPRAIELMCEARLGIQHFHVLRHTFAQAMEQAGAKVSEIQARLGHSSLAVTGRYLAQLSSGKNEYAGIIESYFIDGE